MIPADDFGNGWLIANGDAMGTHLDAQCDTCDGRRWYLGDHTPGLYDAVPCKHCIDGRHTFEIEVECNRCEGDGVLDDDAELSVHEPAMTCQDCCSSLLCPSCESGTVTHRVSIVPGMVIELLGKLQGATSLPAIMLSPSDRWVLHHSPQAKAIREPIDLPPGARPGRWAVQVKVAT